MTTAANPPASSTARKGNRKSPPPAVNGALPVSPSVAALRQRGEQSQAAGQPAAEIAAKAWRRLAKDAARRRPLHRLLRSGEDFPLTWGDLPAEAGSPGEKLEKLADPRAEFVLRGDQLAGVVGSCLAVSPDGIAQSPQAWLFAAHVLARHGRRLPPAAGWKLLDELWKMAHDAAGAPADEGEPDPDRAVAVQLLAIELPLTLAYLFPSSKPLANLARGVRRRQCELFDAALADDGTAAPSLAAVMPTLLASCLRSAALADSVRGKKSPPSWLGGDRRLARIVRQAIRWTAPDRRPFGAGPAGIRYHDGFVRALVRRAGDARIHAALNATGRKAAARRAPKASSHSEPSGRALLRADWSRDGLQVAVDFSSPTVSIEVWNRGRRALAGPWLIASSAAGKSLAVDAGWADVCWFSDDDVDYLELAQPLTGDVRLERQILLLKQDSALLLCDHLRTPAVTTLAHRWSVPLAAGGEFLPEEETRDGRLAYGKQAARVLPLGLAEWRIERRSGELSQRDGALSLEQTAESTLSLAAPLLLDFDRRRSRCPCTWRQLTVAEGLAIQPPSVAVAYRAQSGNDQWAFYRAQSRRGNRTFLGQNHSSEFVALRFLRKSGQAQELIEVEG